MYLGKKGKLLVYFEEHGEEMMPMDGACGIYSSLRTSFCLFDRLLICFNWKTGGGTRARSWKFLGKHVRYLAQSLVQG